MMYFMVKKRISAPLMIENPEDKANWTNCVGLFWVPSIAIICPPINPTWESYPQCDPLVPYMHTAVYRSPTFKSGDGDDDTEKDDITSEKTKSATDQTQGCLCGHLHKREKVIFGIWRCTV